MIVVGVALLDGRGRVLGAQRRSPEALAGLWEFPGGKVDVGETDQEALIRECAEELGCVVSVGAWLGEVPIADGLATLRVWCGSVSSGEPSAREHLALRWLTVDELDEVKWIPADLPLVVALRSVLGGGRDLSEF